MPSRMGAGMRISAVLSEIERLSVYEGTGTWDKRSPVRSERKNDHK